MEINAGVITAYFDSEALSTSFEICALNLYENKPDVVKIKGKVSELIKVSISPANTSMLQRLRNEWKITLLQIQGQQALRDINALIRIIEHEVLTK